MWALILLSIWFCSRIFKINKTASVLMGYVLIRGVFAFSSNPELGQSFTGALSFGSSILLCGLFVWAPRSHVAKVLVILEAVAVIDALLVLKFGFGIFNARTMDTTFLSIMTPVILRRRFMGILTIGLFLYVIYSYGEVMAWSTLIGATMAGLFLKVRWAFWLALAASPMAVLKVYTLVDKGSRPREWVHLMNWWWDHANVWVGTGPGSFEWLGPWIEIKAGMTNDLYMSMHNDHLQLIFEYGFVGYVLFATLFAQALWSSRREVWLFASLVGFSVAMIGYFPVQYMASQVAGICFIALAVHVSRPGPESPHQEP